MTSSALITSKEKYQILVTGGTGFIGKKLVEALHADGHHITVLTRSPERAASLLPQGIAFISEINNELPQVQIVINLAGEPIHTKRWSDKQKLKLRQSRIGLTNKLVNTITRQKQRPTLFISASAIGFYDSDSTSIITEDTKATQNGFAHQLCAAWEHEALKADECGIRTCILRFGAVLGNDGGMLKQMLPAFKAGLGGTMGYGKHWLSWIHVDDIIRLIGFLMEQQDAEGIFNAASPHAVTHKAFAKTLARTLRRPALFPIPPFLISLIFGEMGKSVILASHHVKPKRLMDLGYNFQYETLDAALKQLLRK